MGIEGERTEAFVPRPAPTAPSRTMKQHKPVSTFNHPHHSQDTAVSRALYTLTHTHTLIHIPPPNTHTYTERG